MQKIAGSSSKVMNDCPCVVGYVIHTIILHMVYMLQGYYTFLQVRSAFDAANGLFDDLEGSDYFVNFIPGARQLSFDLAGQQSSNRFYAIIFRSGI